MGRCVGIRTSSPERESAPEGRKDSSLMVGEGEVGSGGGVENGECWWNSNPKFRTKSNSPAHVPGFTKSPETENMDKVAVTEITVAETSQALRIYSCGCTGNSKTTSLPVRRRYTDEKESSLYSNDVESLESRNLRPRIAISILHHTGAPDNHTHTLSVFEPSTATRVRLPTISVG